MVKKYLKVFRIKGPDLLGIIEALNYHQARRIALKELGDLEHTRIFLMKGISFKNKADRVYFGLKNKPSIEITY